MRVQVVAAAAVFSVAMAGATSAQTTQTGAAASPDVVTLQEWRHGSSPFSRDYFDNGADSGSLHYFRHGGGSLSVQHLQHSLEAGGAHYFRYGTGAGSAYFWRHGVGAGSQSDWRYGDGCLSERQWLYGARSGAVCDTTGFSQQVFVLLCLARYISNEACDAWLAAAQEAWPGLAEFQAAVRLP